MAKREKIAVLVATYNGEAYLREQLDSVLSQQGVDFEVHVFDDGSTDDTVGIIERSYLGRPKVFLHRNAQRLGFVRNFEHALRTVDADYYALCDQDDIWRADKLAVSMRRLKQLEKENPGSPALVHSDLERIDAQGRTLGESFFRSKRIDLPDGKALNRIIGHCGVMGNTIVMNRALVNRALPFPPGLKYHDYWLALINELFGVRGTLREPLVSYRIHDRNTSSNRRGGQEGRAGFVARLLAGDWRLPFAEDDREPVLRYLLVNYDIPAQSRGLIQDLCDYLACKGSRVGRFAMLLRRDLLRPDWFYRASVFARLLLTRRYGP